MVCFFSIDAVCALRHAVFLVCKYGLWRIDIELKSSEDSYSTCTEEVPLFLERKCSCMQACLSDTCYGPDKQKGRLSFFFCMLALIMDGPGICKCRVKSFLQDVSKNSLPPHPLKNLFLLKEIL